MAAPVCTIADCGRTAFRTYGICHQHYLRKLKYGDPNGGGMLSGTPLKWLRAHTGHEGDDCLIWPFGRMKGGYGTVWFLGKTTPAHRVMCILAHGDPPAGKPHALHSCGNGHLGCINQQHLRWGTASQNYEDSIEHGTASRGIRHGKNKLSEDDVRRIRKLIADGTAISAIARQYSVTHASIYEIRKGNNWAWLI